MVTIFSSIKIRDVLILILAVVIIFIAAADFRDMHNFEELYPSSDLTEKKMLSDYFSKIKDTPVDTEVYIFEGENKGGTSLVLGGTHPNEPAGYLTSILLLENIQVNTGRVIVIPRSNKSAFTHSSPQEAYPQNFTLKLNDGSERTFKYGSRNTNPIHQWPDPDIYVHPSGQTLSGGETRNLNRSYPGREDGNLTEQLAYGIIQLIKTEEVDIAFDLHEASPEYPVVNAVVAHEKGMDVASVCSMNLQMQDISLTLEPSPQNLRGLSHREFGDYTDSFPFLFETPNPVQGRLRGETGEELLLDGYDIFYDRAADLGLLYVNYDENGWPIERRVARHTTSIVEFLNTFSSMKPGKEVFVENIPDYQDIVSNGVGNFLNKPN